MKAKGERKKKEEKNTYYFPGRVKGELKIEIGRRKIKHFQGVCNQPPIVAC